MADGKIVGMHKFGESSDQTVLFAGDSLMGQFYPRISSLYIDKHPKLSAVFASRDHCWPAPFSTAISRTDGAHCRDYYNAVIRSAEVAGVVRLVLAGNWSFTGMQDPNARQLKDDLLRLKELGREIILLSRQPVSTQFDPINIARSYRAYVLGLSPRPSPDLSLPRGQLEADRFPTHRVLEAIANDVGATLVDPFDFVCSKTACDYLVEGEPIYTDYMHLRAASAKRLATFLDSLVGVGVESTAIQSPLHSSGGDR